MITFEGLRSVFYQKKDFKQILNPNGVLVWVCPLCFNHKQTEKGNNDCKTIMHADKVVDGKIETLGQCCCYSDEHN